MSTALVQAEERYTLTNKLALALRMVMKKLCAYFQAHRVNVLTNFSFKATLQRICEDRLLSGL